MENIITLKEINRTVKLNTTVILSNKKGTLTLKELEIKLHSRVNVTPIRGSRVRSKVRRMALALNVIIVTLKGVKA